MTKRALLKTEESTVKGNTPLLVIDKSGNLGRSLSLELSKDFLVVFASEEKIKGSERVIHVPFKKKTLNIPNNNFSHIFLVSSEDGEGLDLLPSLTSKAKENTSRLIVIVPSTTKKTSIEIIERFSSNVYPITLFVIGDVFGSDEGKVDEYARNVKLFNRLTLPNDGLEEHYPIFIDTLVQEITRSTFQTESVSQTFNMLQKFPVTGLALARIFTKIIPDVEIDFKKQKIQSIARQIPKGEHLIDEMYLEDDIRKILEKEAGAKKEIGKKKKKSQFKKWFFPVILLLLLTPLILTLLFSGLGAVMAKSGVDEMKSGDFQSAQKKFTIARTTFALAGETGESVEKALDLFGLKKESKEFEQALKSGEQLSEAGEDIVGAGIVYKEVLTGASSDPSKDAQDGSQKLRRALTLVQKLRVEPTTPKFLRVEIEKYSDIIYVANSLTDVLPDIIGVTENKNYLLLFQNNMELRPGGGFIGSYGLLPFKKGKVGDVVISDVYDADGKLKGHVEPPYALRRFAGIKHWYLRDSNFHVDFEENAKKAMYFLSLETGEDVDGVIAIDTEVLKGLVSVFGPLRLEGYGENVTEKNIVMLTQVQSQDNFFPGSTQKKDILNAIKSELLRKIHSQEDVSYKKLLSLVRNSISERHVMVVLKDENSQKIISAAGISGKLPGLNSKKDFVNDYLLISEANIGGTKGNMYLKRDISHSVRMSSNNLQEELRISYTNTSKKDTKYGGDYLGYLQLVLPRGAALKSIKINNELVSILSAVTDPEIYEDADFSLESGIEVLTESFGDKRIIGFPIDIPADGKKTFIVTYAIPIEANTERYSLRIAKQPGALSDPYLLRIYYPDTKRPSKLDGLEDKISWGEYRGELVEDKEVSVVFDK